MGGKYTQDTKNGMKKFARAAIAATAQTQLQSRTHKQLFIY